MTFLNPAILWGLAAVSIPIIIHIFNLKRTKKIEFSTLMFLKEIQQSKYKKIKLKQLLILLCRIAMIIFLVFAFSRPFKTGYLGAGERARSTVLLILDNSFSMQARATGGSDFENAKKKIIETISLLDENDEVYFATSSNINKPKTAFKNLEALRDSVSNTKISDVTRDLNEVLYYAKDIISSAANPNKEIFLFTDGQKSFMQGSVYTGAEKKFDEQTNLNIILCSERSGNNISLDTINTITKIFEKNRNVKLKCTVNNRNNFNVTNKSVLLNFGNGKYKDEKNIDIPANSSVEVEFNFTPGVTGFAGGYVELVQSEIADDEIQNDNRRYFAFKVPDKVKLLMVSPISTDLKYINLALASSEEMMKDSAGTKSDFFNTKQITPDNLAGEDLKNYDCILFAGCPSFKHADADKLYDYVQSGHGIIIFPSQNIDIENYNDILLKRFELPPVSGFYGNSSGSETFVFDKIDFEHPVFEGIYKQPAADVTKDSPKIKSGIDLLSGTNTQSLVKLSNQKSFLNEYTSGKGKILIFSVSPDEKWSDFPSANLFSPLTVRSILYISAANPVKEAINGKDYYAELNEEPGNDTIIVTDLQNQIYRLESNNSQQTTLLNLKDCLNTTSNYTVSKGNSVYSKFPSNFSKPEANTEIMDNKEISGIIKQNFKISPNIITNREPLNASVIELRKGKEIWKYFIFITLMFLALEFVISRSFSKTA